METKKSKLVADNSSHVRISNKIIRKVKAVKKKTRIPIGEFFEQAAIEKLADKRIIIEGTVRSKIDFVDYGVITLNINSSDIEAIPLGKKLVIAINP